ncbi:MAG: hypothetical protein ACKOXD_03770, partial [Acinetobacter sp.]
GLSLSEFILDTYVEDPMIVFTSLFITSLMFLILSIIAYKSSISITGYGSYFFAGILAILITHLFYVFGLITLQAKEKIHFDQLSLVQVKAYLTAFLKQDTDALTRYYQESKYMV